MSTVKAAFGRGIELVNLDKRSPIPGRFVLKLSDKFRPPHVTDGFCQTVVLDHILNLQTLDTDRLVLTDQLCRELVLRITASVTDPRMDASHLETSLGAVLGALLFLGEATLSPCQLLLILVEEFGIAGGVPIRGDHHGLQAQIKPHLRLHHRQELDVFFDQDGDKVATSGVFAYRDGRGLAPFGQGTRPVDVKRSIHFRQGKRLPIPFKGGSGVFSGLWTFAFLEGGIVGTAFKEVLEGFLKVSQGLLRRHRGDLVEPSMVSLLLQKGEAGRGFMIADPLLILVGRQSPKAEVL